MTLIMKEIWTYKSLTGFITKTKETFSGFDWMLYCFTYQGNGRQLYHRRYSPIFADVPNVFPKFEVSLVHYKLFKRCALKKKKRLIIMLFRMHLCLNNVSDKMPQLLRNQRCRKHSLVCRSIAGLCGLKNQPLCRHATAVASCRLHYSSQRRLISTVPLLTIQSHYVIPQLWRDVISFRIYYGLRLHFSDSVLYIKCWFYNAR